MNIVVMNIRTQCFVELNVPNPGPLKIKHKDEMRCAKDSLVEVTEGKNQTRWNSFQTMTQI